jgi:glycine cleavage system aminomethyltransferase T
MTGVLDFVSPGAAADAGGFHPVARSPLDRRFREAGASFAERDGWAVPVSVPGEHAHLAAVGIADLSHLTKLEVRPALAPPSLVTDRYKAWYAISPRRALVLCEAGHADEIRGAVEGRFVLDVTAQHAIVAIVGPEAGTVLRRMTHLHHFPAGGEVAHVTAHVLEQSGGFWIVCPQEYGHYMVEVAVDRATALSGGLVGVDVLGANA